MHIAIDDTYSSNVNIQSQYVTADRRTNVAVCFHDADVAAVRNELIVYLCQINDLFGMSAEEFHFVEIMNKKKLWAGLPQEQILPIFSKFVQIYNSHQWPVLIQTIDHRTLGDHGLTIQGSLDGIDLSKKEGQSLMMLLIRIKHRFLQEPQLTILMDEGQGSPGQRFGEAVFASYGGIYDGYFESSKAEPLLQVADFVAYVINRSTNLSTKANRSPDENLFIRLAGSLQLNTSDVTFANVPKNFGQTEFDAIHQSDRQAKGLEP